MGSNPPTIDRKTAARQLDISVEDINHLVDAGVLHYTSEKSGRLNRRDVDELQLDKQLYHVNPASVSSILSGMRVRIQSLERRVNFLLEINGMDVSILREASDQDLLTLYDKIRLLDADTLYNIRPKDARQLASVFLQFTEIEFYRLRELTGNDTPWTCIHDCCLQLMQQIHDHPEFRSSDLLAEIYRILDKARRQLNASVEMVLGVHRTLTVEDGEPKLTLRSRRAHDTLDVYIDDQVRTLNPWKANFL